MSQPAPDERLRERLSHLPDACRAMLAAVERQAARGGGDVQVVLIVTAAGRISKVVVPTVYESTLDKAV